MKSWICRPCIWGSSPWGGAAGSGGDAGGLHLGGADHHGAAAPGAGKTTLEQRVSKYIVSTVRFVLWVVTVLIVAQQLGIPVTSLVALFSVVSLAVSLAVQNVLANVAGGLVLLVTKPFTVGGLHRYPPAGEGTVREMSLTYTFLETMEGQRLAVPNSTLSSGKIINYSTLATRRLQHKITASTTMPRRTCEGPA